MAKKDPHASIQFYIGDRLKELMPIYSDSEAVGAWTKAWMYLWANGPAKLEVLRKAVGSGWDSIGFMFTETDGLFSLDWVEEKRAETDAYKAKQSANGRKGGRPKSRKLKEKNPPVSETKPKKSPRGEGDSDCVGDSEGVDECSDRGMQGGKVTVDIYPTFDDFWDAYGKKIDRPKCERLWARIPQRDREAIMQHVPAYVEATPDVKYRRNPLTYLNGKNWNDDDLTRPQTDPRSGLAKAQQTQRELDEYYARKAAEYAAGTGGRS